MKLIYETPTVEIVKLESEDILKKSGEGNVVLPDDDF